ncbi:unnamed protein product [Cochlearia groenlandica]
MLRGDGTGATPGRRIAGMRSPGILLRLRGVLFRSRAVLPDPGGADTLPLSARDRLSSGLAELHQTSGTFAIYPNTNRNLVYDFPEKDSGWMDQYFFFRITKSSIGEMHEGSTALVRESGSGVSGSPPLLKRPRSRPPPTYTAKKEREARLTTLAKVKKEEISAFKASGEKPRVNLVADWVLQRAPDELRAVVASPCVEDGGEEEEEGLERRKRKRGSEDAGASPRADARTRSKSADPVKGNESSMRPPAIRSDRSTQPGAASQVAPQRVAPRCDGSGHGSAHHVTESGRTRGSEDRLLVVNAENWRARRGESGGCRTGDEGDPYAKNGRDRGGEDLEVRGVARCDEGQLAGDVGLPGRDLEAEAASMAEDLLVVEGKLAAMPLPSLDLDELARRFDDSPPPEDEIGYALNLRGGDPPEESGPPVEDPAERDQDVASVEEEATQPGTGISGEVEEEGQT